MCNSESKSFTTITYNKADCVTIRIKIRQLLGIDTVSVRTKNRTMMAGFNFCYDCNSNNMFQMSRKILIYK